ncbi:sulfite oxidase cytochrome subunit [Salinisphaera sp. T31B1]
MSLILGWTVGATAEVQPEAGEYGLGDPASEAEIAGWDIDVPPSGAGLPAGSGTAAQGEAVYNAQCAACHGPEGKDGAYPRLSGGQGTLASDKPVKTVGSYWPYATTLYDYIHRAMPFTAPQSLSADDTYAVTAYVLYINGIIDRDTTLDADTLAGIVMPNRDGFISPDPRPDVHNTACMDHCDERANGASGSAERKPDDGVPTM